MKKFTMLAACLLCIALLAACGPKSPAPSTASAAAEYRVKVTDHLGTAYTSGVIVRFMRDGQQAAMQPVNKDGVASKTLDRGDYTVELVFTDAETQYYYEKDGLTLSGEKTELAVTLAQGVSGDPVELYVQSEPKNAYDVSVGCTYVPLTSGERSYLLFYATEPGTYRITVVGNTAKLGCYGAPHLVQERNVAEIVDNVFTTSISADMIGGTSVLGLDAVDDAEGCVLTIQRIGDPEWTIADEPWIVYEAKTPPTPYTLPEGTELNYVDVTAATGEYELVKGGDGFYHLNSADGPVVLMHLGPKAPMELSLKEMILGTGKDNSAGGTGGNPFRAFFFNEDGGFLKKEEYTDCMTSYIRAADPQTGVYPLTDDLLYMFKNAGKGWWTSSSPDYLFGGIADVNPDIAWMFLFCWAE